MRDFIFDIYGYYMEKEHGSSFDYNSWHFALELTDKSEAELLSMKEFLTVIPSLYPNHMADIVLSKKGKLLNSCEFGKVCLVAVKNTKTTLNDFLNFPFLFANSFMEKTLTIDYIKEVWINKKTKIEDKILNRVKLDSKSYPYFMENYLFANYLCLNAIQYLNDLIHDEDSSIDSLSLVHKRIEAIDAYTLLNPLNFVVDFKGRDLAFLIKNSFIKDEDLNYIFRRSNLSKKDASMIIARLLYPTEFYDILEEHYLAGRPLQDKIFRYSLMRKEKLKKIKKVYSILINLYPLRRIPWIEEL